MNGPPPQVLLARLEHELTTIGYALTDLDGVAATAERALERALDLTTKLRNHSDIGGRR